MNKIKLLLTAVYLFTLITVNTSYGVIRPIYKVGSYFEFVMSFDLTSLRFSGKVVSETILGNIKYQVLRIYNEPAMGDYNQYYYYDTTANILYSRGGYTNGCLDSDMKQKVVGFNWPMGYIFNTCYDTIGGIFRKSIVSDTGTYAGIFNTGIPLRIIQRIDTTGAPADIARTTMYSEMFGFLGFYQNTGAPFGSGWYSIDLVGAIIDSVQYGSLLLYTGNYTPRIIKAFTLYQNYPNPFNPKTSILFAIPRTSSVKVLIYDVMGRELQTLVDERLPAGSFQRTFDGVGLSSGVYFYKLVVNGVSETKSMLLLK